ncbi:MAG: hypothetical protein ABSG22_12095 [Sedimentisphaerales bacterium]|jgi:hypothetical protein
MEKGKIPKSKKSIVGRSRNKINSRSSDTNNPIKKKRSAGQFIRTKVKENAETETNPLSITIDKFLHRIWGLQYAGLSSLAELIDLLKKQYSEARSKLAAIERLMSSKNQDERAIGSTQAANILPKIRLIADSDITQTTSNAYFIALFSCLDSFIGEFLTCLYSRNPILFRNLNSSKTILEIIEYDTIDDVKKGVLQEEIESLLRESYIKHFEKLGARFNISLVNFAHWPTFVECSQRRNLITHCDGVVNSQYLKGCIEQGCKWDQQPRVGDRLIIKPDYFLDSARIVMEVGLKLGQTLWRKALPAELKFADDHLIDCTFQALKRKTWPFAQILGEFANGLPDYSSEATKHIFLVNYAIALKYGGKPEKANSLINSIDWTAVIDDFKLAREVLIENYKRASEIMKRIGIEGQFVDEHAYHDWPLFLDFRKSKEFAKAYESIYGHSFIWKSQRIANTLKNEIKKEQRKLKKVSASLSTAKGKVVKTSTALP